MRRLPEEWRLTQTPYNSQISGALLLLPFAGTVIFLGGFERFLEADHVFAGTQVVERFRFALQLFLGIIRGLDRETDPALDLVHLDDTGFDFLPDLEHVLNLRDVIFAELRNVNEPIDVVLQLHERAEARQLRDLALHQIADLVFRIDLFPRIFAQLFNAEADPL